MCVYCDSRGGAKMKIPSYFKSLFKSKVQELHKKNLELNDLLAEYCQRNVDLKNENDQLTKSMSELYLENLELKNELEQLFKEFEDDTRISRKHRIYMSTL